MPWASRGQLQPPGPSSQSSSLLQALQAHPMGNTKTGWRPPVWLQRAIRRGWAASCRGSGCPWGPGIFAARLVKKQECSCPGLSSVWGCTEGQRLGRSRAGCVSPRERELGWCRPGPCTFSKSLLSGLLFQPLSLFPRVCGSGLPHFPREHTGHSKHLLPTTQEKTLHMDITRWSTPKSD